jgi:hypothetical protein
MPERVEKNPHPCSKPGSVLRQGRSSAGWERKASHSFRCYNNKNPGPRSFHPVENRGAFTKILAIVGTLLAWFPLLAPVLLTAILYLRKGIFRFDYLMPAELFLVAVAGAALLLWASALARSQRRLIRWGIALAAIMIVGGQPIASVTGLASGEIEPEGWPWALVTASLVAYILALAVTGTGGILLLRDLFKPSS